MTTRKKPNKFTTSKKKKIGGLFLENHVKKYDKKIILVPHLLPPPNRLYIIFLKQFFVVDFRYIAIMHPLRPRMRLRKALVIVSAIWIFGAIAAGPNLFTFTIVTQNYTSGDQRVVCYSEWPDGITNESQMEYG